jgi:hypothetical protein
MKIQIKETSEMVYYSGYDKDSQVGYSVMFYELYINDKFIQKFSFKENVIKYINDKYFKEEQKRIKKQIKYVQDSLNNINKKQKILNQKLNRLNKELYKPKY